MIIAPFAFVNIRAIQEDSVLVFCDAMDKRRESQKLFMLRLSEKDKELFIAAARQDGYEELAPWLRWVAKTRAKKTLEGALPSASMDTSRPVNLRRRRPRE
jgi:hypothetical protein